ncbi:hypothetical protein VB734_11770 [Synechococcus sp. BA-124 BA4]|uniref:hypothetical protein n=1 Tax=Synechococcus sp. BA-124 BA4 TaxID=3110251 RepID=UPI002B207322|nr:hypothetical protein [Synechococcus sp. BA-124 BA4]MEA5400715.1 hypothetical protein [Synechococcus sp. BA-124 BA4]
MQLVEVHSALDHHRFRAALGIGLEPAQRPDWFAHFDEVLRSSSWFQPYLRRTPHQRWILRDQRATIGRIMAMHPAEGPSRFGLYSCIDNPEASLALTRAAEAWARDRGSRIIIGPFNPSIHDECGLLEHSTCPSLYGYPQTPEHYIDNLEFCGYQRAKRLLTFLQTDERNATRIAARMQPLLEVMPEHGLRLEVAKWSTLGRDVQWVEHLINNCWGSNWGFEPIGKAEARNLVLKVLMFLPRGVLSFVSLHGKPVAVSLGIPNAKEIASELNPSLGILNLPQLFLRLRRCQCKRGRIALLGVIPELQGSQLSLMACTAMLRHLINTGQALGSCSASMGWILEDNHSMLRFLKLYGGEQVMSHLIMAKSLDTLDQEQ